jgi:hypothetical protein
MQAHRKLTELCEKDGRSPGGKLVSARSVTVKVLVGSKGEGAFRFQRTHFQRGCVVASCGRKVIRNYEVSRSQT